MLIVSKLIITWEDTLASLLLKYSQTQTAHETSSARQHAVFVDKWCNLNVTPWSMSAYTTAFLFGGGSTACFVIGRGKDAWWAGTVCLPPPPFIKLNNVILILHCISAPPVPPCDSVIRLCLVSVLAEPVQCLVIPGFKVCFDIEILKYSTNVFQREIKLKIDFLSTWVKIWYCLFRSWLLQRFIDLNRRFSFLFFHTYVLYILKQRLIFMCFSFLSFF